MRYAQFYHMSVNYDGKHPSRPIEACGDRSVLILDGRNRVEVSASFAENECKKRRYVGFSIHEGETFNRSRQITKFKAV